MRIINSQSVHTGFSLSQDSSRKKKKDLENPFTYICMKRKPKKDLFQGDIVRQGFCGRWRGETREVKAGSNELKARG